MWSFSDMLTLIVIFFCDAPVPMVEIERMAALCMKDLDDEEMEDEDLDDDDDLLVTQSWK